ncbi:MAG: hypothetical protein ACRDY4_09120 [Acidimicrobiia bacterium]
MRRPPKGATHGPTLVRPGNGFGRPVGRPEPGRAARTAARVYRRWWLATTDVVESAVAETLPVGQGTTPGVLDGHR